MAPESRPWHRLSSRTPVTVQSSSVYIPAPSQMWKRIPRSPAIARWRPTAAIRIPASSSEGRKPVVHRSALALEIGRESNASTLRFRLLHERADRGEDVSNSLVVLDEFPSQARLELFEAPGELSVRAEQLA